MRRVTVLLLAVLASTAVASAASADTITGDGAPNVLFGTSHADSISGLGDSDSLFGRGGADVLFGGDGQDFLFGAKGKDRLSGEGDDDIIRDDAGGRKPDRIFGGPGEDSIAAADGKRDIIDCGDEAGPVFDSVRADPIDELIGCELVYDENGDHANINFGTNKNNAIAHQGSIFGRGGNDTLHGTDASADQLFGGPGTDILQGLNGDDDLYDDDGTPGDQLLAGDGIDRIYSADGAADTVSCGDGTLDKAWVDEIDDVSGCETIFEG